MHIETRNLTLVPHVPAHLLALMESNAAYEKTSGMRIADGVREFLLAGSPDSRAQLQVATGPDPWNFGFAILHKIDNLMIGLCGFAGPPDSEGVVEVAYSIAPAYQGKGLATEAATVLVAFARQSGRVRIVRAHTFPKTNPSTSVLKKCGFKKTGEIVDSENNLVWRWERLITPES
ncbi:MAG: [ribosomal protein S5]-alanine N-acetyltransferase [Verrucomicrobiota bacterium]